MKTALKHFNTLFSSKRIIVLLAVLNVFPVFAQKNRWKNDSIANRDSIKEFMFQGALLSMDALQAKYESQKNSDPYVKHQKSGESQNLFFQSRSAYRKAIRLDVNYYPAWTSVGTTYFMEELPKASIPYFRKAIFIKSNYSPAWFNLGKAYDALSMHDSAVYSFQQSIRFDSTSVQSYKELSRMIMANGKDSAAALKLLRLAAHYQPASEVPWVAMSSIYFSMNDSTRAIASLEEATQVYSGDIQRLEILANYFQNHKDQQKAIYYSNLLASEKKKQEVPIDTDK